MKPVLVMDSVSRAAGGLLDAERCLHLGLGGLGVETAVFALEDKHTAADLPSWSPLIPKVFPHQGPAALGCSVDMRQAILTSSADLIYRAGLWRMPSRYAHEWTRKYRRPEIIAPHGMLDPWAVRNSRCKKCLAHLWFEGAHLRDAFCIRALCESEAQSIRAYGLKNPVCVIPNGVEVPEDRGQRPEDRGQEKILLFLGRLHPKKGLVNALKAWKQSLHSASNIQNSKSHEWQFVVSGWDQGGHEASLKRLCTELGLSYLDIPASDYVGETPTLLESSSVSHPAPLGTIGRAQRSRPTDLRPLASGLRPLASGLWPPASVIFTGPAFGETKDQLLRRASAFILPSFSEGLPMSVLEAWAYRLPVLMTDHCNLPEGFLSDAALRIDTDVTSIAEGMRLLTCSLTSDLCSLGRNGRALVERQFTWPQVAAQMKEVYDWVLGGGSRPGSIQS